MSLRRCIQKLRKKIKNKAPVEASIVEALLVEEDGNTLVCILDPHAPSIRNKMSHYDDCASSFQGACDLDGFKRLVYVKSQTSSTRLLFYAYWQTC